MRVDVDPDIERLSFGQRIDRAARRNGVHDDLGHRFHRTESGVALILAPKQHILILWHGVGGLCRGCSGKAGQRHGQ